MKYLLPFTIGIVTLVLIAIAWFQSGVVQRHEMRSADSPEQAVRLMLSQVQSHNWDGAYQRLANRNDVDKNAFVRDLAGSYGSILTYASLESFDVWGLHSSDQDATFRARLHYSTAVGQLDDVRDLTVHKTGDTWKVVWPVNNATKLPPQVIPVNYLRWDVIGRGAGDEWGVSNVDTPQVRILSMNPIQRPDGVVLVGEVVNEDSVPAFITSALPCLMRKETKLPKRAASTRLIIPCCPNRSLLTGLIFPTCVWKKLRTCAWMPRQCWFQPAQTRLLRSQPRNLKPTLWAKKY